MRKMSEVLIESPSMNSRRITASILIDCPTNVVWSILTDYNNLATHVPNLVQSYLVPSPTGGLRLFQEGAQKIIGFDFRASLVMDMQEERDEETEKDKGLKEWMLRFKCVESQMFDAFDGTWSLRYHSRTKEFDPKLNKQVFKYKSKLTYSVFVRPRGPVPVIALEWRIKEDVPVNLYAVKLASERKFNLYGDAEVDRGQTADGRGVVPGGETRRSLPTRVTEDWAPDETLGSYIISANNKNSSSSSDNNENSKNSNNFNMNSAISSVGSARSRAINMTPRAVGGATAGSRSMTTPLRMLFPTLRTSKSSLSNNKNKSAW